MSSVQFILASSSPRRLELLKEIGIVPDKIVAPTVSEDAKDRELPRKLALRLAKEKCAEVASREKTGYILAADTVVACGRRILPKAATQEDVRQCLGLLSGRRHRVYTGIALRAENGKMTDRVIESTVIFNTLSHSEIEGYIATHEGVGKAGGYGIQGRAAVFVRFISGSYSNIVGLPLFEVAQMLRGAGYRI